MSEEQQSVGAAGDFFPCSSCGAKLHYDATLQAMKCPYCGGQQAVSTSAAISPTETCIQEGFRKAARGYGTPVQQVSCGDCGATVAILPGEQTAVCVFCKSHQVLAREAMANPIKPEYMVPFKLDKNAAANKFEQWLGELWFRPNNLKKAAKIDELTGTYIPYWTFDAHIDASWTAEAGYHYYVEEEYEDAQGKKQTRKVQHTRWEPASGRRSDDYDDVIVCGSKGLPPELSDQLLPFNTKELTSYDPRLLAGWRAEVYAVDLLDAWFKGENRMKSMTYNRCEGDIPGDTNRNLNVNSTVSRETFKHVLLPVWIAAYRYQDKPFQFLVNGQTGEVVGKAPYSALKIFLFILFILAIIGGIAFATQDKWRPRKPARAENTPTFTLAFDAGQCRLASHALET